MVPGSMVRAQKNLGIGLQRLGELEDNSARLQQAVAAYRAALEEITYVHEAFRPLLQAEIQNGLGDALRALGERETGTTRLEEAIVAYDSAIVSFSLVSEDIAAAYSIVSYVETCRIERDRAIVLLNQRRR
jgi:tetratricopeptide (TPR) repeat protein